jgi:hypothetical protein
MTSQVKAVVEAFERLTPDEQIAAYLEIEKIWKDQQNNGGRAIPQPISYPDTLDHW